MGGIKTYFILLVFLAIIGSYQCGRSGGGSFSNDDKINTDVDTSNVELSISRSVRSLRTTPRSQIRTTSRPHTTKRTNRPTTQKRTTPKTTTRRPTTRKTTPYRTTTYKTTKHRTTPRPTTYKTTTYKTTKYRTTPRPTTYKTTTYKTTPRPTTYKTTTYKTTTYRTTPRPTTYKTTTYKTTPRRVTHKTTPYKTTYLPTYKTTTKKPFVDVRYPITTLPTKKKTTYYTTHKPTTSRKHKTTPKIRVNSASFDDLPARPGSRDKSKPVKIKIVNKYNYHYPGYYTIPVPHERYPGYFYTHSTYSYTSHDTGDGALGFYLGYKLAKMSTPTYNHETFFDGYQPRYDHYSVHHYYHNPEAIPPRQEIYPSNIIDCVGDSGQICPANTSSVCTRDGNLMCVVPATRTIACHNNLMCTRSLISCVNNTASECSGKQNSTWIDIPCLSTAKIYGHISVVNNTISISNSLMTNFTALFTNSTINATSTSTTTTSSPLTVTSSVVLEPTTSAFWKWKRQVLQSNSPPAASIAQDMCVTVVALPAKRIETQGETLYKEAKNMLNKFFDSVWA